MLKFSMEKEIPDDLRGLNACAWQMEIVLKVPWDRFYLQPKADYMYKLKYSFEIFKVFFWKKSIYCRLHLTCSRWSR